MSSRPINTQQTNQQNSAQQTQQKIEHFINFERNTIQQAQKSQNQNFHPFNHNNSSENIPSFNVKPADHLQLNASKPEPSYRIVSYPIENKKYRLVSLTQEEEDSNSASETGDLNVDDDFREPAFMLPRFNPFGRWNARNQGHERRRNFLNESRRIISMRNRKSYLQSILSNAKKIYSYIRSIRLSSWYEYVPFYPHPPTLESKYRNISLAILNNSISLESAVIKALEYNIPLMQIVMNPSNTKEEQTVVEKILKDFTIAHFINQNFVLFGDWNHFNQYKEVFMRNSMQEENQHDINQQNPAQRQGYPSGGKIVFRKGEIVFAEIELSYVQRIDHNQMQQKLEEIRNHYYHHKQIYRNPSSMISQARSNVEKIPSSMSQEVNSNGPYTKPKTVKEIEDQILKDYLQQKMQQEMIERESMQQEQYSGSQVDSYEEYSGERGSFESSEISPSKPQNENHNQNHSHSQDLDQNSMIESRNEQAQKKESSEEKKQQKNVHNGID